MKPFTVSLCLLIIFSFPAFTIAQKIENFKLKDLKDEKVELKQLLKRGPILLDFWATWCKPCATSMPELNTFYKKYRNSGLQVIGINEDGDRTRAKVEPFIRDLKIEYLILLDDNNDVMRKLGVNRLPAALLIARNGKVVARFTDLEKDVYTGLQNEIEALLQKSAKK